MMEDTQSFGRVQLREFVWRKKSSEYFSEMERRSEVSFSSFSNTSSRPAVSF